MCLAWRFGNSAPVMPTPFPFKFPSEAFTGSIFQGIWSWVYACSPGYGRIAMGVGLLGEEEEGEERTVPGLE